MLMCSTVITIDKKKKPELQLRTQIKGTIKWKNWTKELRWLFSTDVNWPLRIIAQFLHSLPPPSPPPFKKLCFIKTSLPPNHSKYAYKHAQKRSSVLKESQQMILNAAVAADQKKKTKWERKKWQKWRRRQYRWCYQWRWWSSGCGKMTLRSTVFKILFLPSIFLLGRKKF